MKTEVSTNHIDLTNNQFNNACLCRIYKMIPRKYKAK